MVEPRLTTTPYCRKELFWECPKCKYEHGIQYLECDEEVKCSECGAIVYVAPGNEADETDIVDM